MRTLLLVCLALPVPLVGAEAARTFSLWDGKETVESYAARVNLPATKSIDLGGGVKLDLVLIPAGQFIMGSPEPEKPRATEEGAFWLIALGGGTTAVLLWLLAFKDDRKRKLSFSLRWLLLLTIATGVCVGGIARRSLAKKEAERYANEMAEYIALPEEEKPAHSVTLTQPFYMGKYTVILEQYDIVMGYHERWPDNAQLPVESVSWNDATAFCTKLNGIMRDKMFQARLPTEAQWEYACRAGTRTRFYSGDTHRDLDKVGWYAANSGNSTHTVGQKKPNAFGLYDMHGNVFQWCEDGYDGKYYWISPSSDPMGPQKNDARVLRGGSWAHLASDCRAARRLVGTVHRNEYIGFRIVILLGL